MPQPADEQVVKTGAELVETLKTIFHTPPGFRPAHAKGLLLTGTFTPTAEAGTLTTAPHFNAASTPIIVRFSSSTGIPQIPDTDANGNPRGFAIRFNLPSVDGKRVHTDMIAHSTPFFPVRTGELFLEFLKSLMSGTVEAFLGGHPSALAFVQAPKPFPVSLAKEAYYGVTALKFVAASGKETYFRHRIIPVAGVEHLTEDEVKTKDAEYLFEDLPERVKTGPIKFKLVAQLAEDGDVTDDATVHWPDSRKIVELGTISLESVVDQAEQASDQKKIIFDPIPRISGIEPSADPLLDVRASLYLTSGKQRRAA